MEIQLPKITVESLKEQDLDWFIHTAAVNMLVDEVGRPELVNFTDLYKLAHIGMNSETAFVAKEDGVCIGALGGLLLPNLFNSNITTLAEVFWYVLPDYRNSRAGFLLFDAFNKRAEQCADEATLSLLGSSVVNVNSLEKRGFKMGEFAFRKQYKEM